MRRSLALTRRVIQSRPSSQCQPTRMHSSGESEEGKEMVNINWKNRDGTITATRGAVGSSLLSLARKYEIELEGACEGVCACSTCHVILEDNVFDSLPDPSEDEEDMLGKYEFMGAHDSNSFDISIVTSSTGHSNLYREQNPFFLSYRLLQFFLLNLSSLRSSLWSDSNI